MASCVAILRATTNAHQGTVVKTIGDAVMCTFASATIALQAACAMQIAVKNAPIDGGNSMHISIGFHYGSAIWVANDVFGDTVNVASRIASHARAHQIMTSQAVVDALSDELRHKTDRIMAAEFKGKQVEFDIFIVAWNEEDQGATYIQQPIVLANSKPTDSAQLTLRYGDRAFTLNQSLKIITLGRGEDCNFVIPNTKNSPVSRLHASVEFRFGKFFIVDKSSNGTFVRSAEGNIHHITRKEMILLGAGVISPGLSFTENPTQLLTFSLS